MGEMLWGRHFGHNHDEPEKFKESGMEIKVFKTDAERNKALNNSVEHE